MLLLVCVPLLALTLTSSRPGVGSLTSARASVRMQGNLFKIVDMPTAKAGALIKSYSDRVMIMRSNGFQPNVECWMPDRQPQVKRMNEKVSEVGNIAKAAGASKQLTHTDAVGAEPESERIARTRAVVALAATGGTSVVLVSYWPDHVDFEASVVNPGKLAVGEAAERAVIRHVIAEALERGCTDIRLFNREDRFFQLGGDAFYEPCGLYPSELKAEVGTVLTHRAE